MGWESCDVVQFDLGPLLQGQMRTVKLKSAYKSVIIGPRGLQCETNFCEIMGWESCDMVRFDFGPLLQDQPNLKVLISPLLLVLVVCNMKLTSRKSWAGNHLMWSDLTLGPFFKVK